MALITWTGVWMALAATAPTPHVPEPSLVTETRKMMGTQVSLLIVEGDPKLTAPAVKAAWSEIERVERVMNEWRPDSALSAINAAAGSRRFVSAPRDLCQVLQRSLEAARRTDGLFDPTWATLRDLWRFDGRGPPHPPDESVLAERCEKVGHEGVELRWKKETCEVRLVREGMQLGLGGVAKGWAVDRATRALRAHGLKDFIVQAGGDLYASGTRGNRPWKVGIRDPRGPPEKYFAQLEVRDAAFSTSGDYERFFVVDGRRFHHLIDPRDCRPARASRSASVLARSAVEAELLTKATFILGGERALSLAASWEAEAVLVGADNRVHVSPSLGKRLVQLAEPSDGSTISPAPP